MYFPLVNGEGILLVGLDRWGFLNLLRADMKIKNKEHLETLYDIVSDTWNLFQQDFEGDPGLEFSPDYEDLTLLHDHLKSLVNLDPTIVYPYEMKMSVH